ncbi:MAG: DUF2878 domain-containing protein [Planctomycetota bacterium]|jgi:hypothetical protein
MRIAVNFLLFQAGWFACVAGPAWVGPAAVALVVAVDLAWTRRRAHEAKTVLASGALGSAADLLLANAGLLAFRGGGYPLWMAALWLNFGTILNVSLAWLKGRWWLAAVLGAVCGPLVYLGGERLGATVLQPGTLVAVAAQFAVAVPGLLWIARRLGEKRCSSNS